MIPVILQLGPLPINSFGLMMVLCFLSAHQRLALSLRDHGETWELAEPMIFWAAVGGVVGARLDYLISFPSDAFARGWIGVFGGSGFVYYGGFVGGVFAVWCVLRKHKKNFLKYADLSAPALALGYAVGRIGCHLSGDGDYGIPTARPWGVSYVLGVMPTDPGVIVHPTPLYESFAAFLITAILLQLHRRTSWIGTGKIFAVYLILSALSRYLVETIRIEPLVWHGFTQAQVASLGVGAAALLLLFRPVRTTT